MWSYWAKTLSIWAVVSGERACAWARLEARKRAGGARSDDMRGMMGFLWGRMDSGKNDSDNSHRMGLGAQGLGDGTVLEREDGL